MTPLIVGLDPGPTRSAMALVRTLPMGRVLHLRSGMVPSQPDAMLAWLQACGLPGTVTLAREQVSGYAYAHVRSAALLATQDRGARFVGTAQAHGYAVVEASAEQWRRQLTGRGAANDAAIKRALAPFVDGLPARTNAHVRDALGVALFAAWWGALPAAARAVAGPRRAPVVSQQMVAVVAARKAGQS